MQKRIDSATAVISQKMLVRLATLDVEEKYRRVAPRFDVSELSISVLSDDGDWHFLAEVGSASNWVSFHVALMCALQEFFLGVRGSVTPTLVVLDQPSQVYFPHVARGPNPPGYDPDYQTDEDAEAVRSIFETLAQAVADSGGKWQAIVLDHADASVYGGVSAVHEVANWRGREKLIPLEWIEAAEKAGT